MSNTAQITSDLRYAYINDCENGGKIAISNRGVLISVLGNSLVGSPLTAELDNSLASILKVQKPFYEFPATDLAKNHLCISYQEQSNTLFVVGITDVIVGYSVPQNIKPENTRIVGVKLKARVDQGLLARHVVLVRQERGVGSVLNIAFYLIDTIK